MIYKLNITGHTDIDLIRTIQKKYQDEVPGIRGLYFELQLMNSCESHDRARIFYVGYTLAKYNIQFKYSSLVN